MTFRCPEAGCQGGGPSKVKKKFTGLFSRRASQSPFGVQSCE